MRSLVRRDTEDYETFVRGLAKSSGVETPKRRFGEDKDMELIKIGNDIYYRNAIGSTEAEVLCYAGNSQGMLVRPKHWLCADCYDKGRTPSRLKLFLDSTFASTELWVCGSHHQLTVDKGLRPSNTCGEAPNERTEAPVSINKIGYV